ncbi:hypothetical protein Acel_0666 [Acidothermus cellulolyticus 11B]|uniref:DUF6457 domain-containing protein n=1 Tax=Acidothermus cellulolyticus (strain ATCC 43068 / DSM 8971 / 11B) TaxID=351607 RepID=A0LSM9_ACIC1|nr:DUF6457 domain-containing protein [Acidothermus cellulolyticus]ABK52439.1 hypothetical protein Acel_0666 [Acidothermus cellulolyticus 11B]
MSDLDTWFDTVRTALDVAGVVNTAARDAVLDLTRDVAHDVARPAAPLTAFLAGVAVGRGASLPDVVARIRGLANQWTAAAEPSPAGNEPAEPPP